MTAPNDSIDLLPIKNTTKRRLKEYGFTSIHQIRLIIENNQTDRIRVIPGIGSKKMNDICRAALEFVSADIKTETKEKEEEDKKEEVVIMKERREINKHDVGRVMLEFIISKLNDPNFPKYPAAPNTKYPHSEILYTDEFILVNIDWLESEFSVELSTYKIYSAGSDLQLNNSVRLGVANLRYLADPPIYFSSNPNSGKLYAFSAYTTLTGNQDKYIKIFRDKLESSMNVVIDTTMSDELTEEWARFDQVAVTEDEEAEKWNDAKVRSEVEANKGYNDNATCTILDYCYQYMRQYGGFKNINTEVLEYCRKYFKVSRNPRIKADMNKMIGRIEEDTGVVGMTSAMEGRFTPEKATIVVKGSKKEEAKAEDVKEVLEKDLENLPEEMKKDIINNILPPKNKFLQVVCNACVVFGDNCNAMVTVITRNYAPDNFSFTTSTESASYMFNKNDCANGMLSVPDSLKGKEIEIKNQIIEQIKNF